MSLVCFEMNVSLMAGRVFSPLCEQELPITSVLMKHGVGSELNSFSQLLQCVCGGEGAAAVTGAASQSPAPESETPPYERRTTGSVAHPEDVCNVCGHFRSS